MRQRFLKQILFFAGICIVLIPAVSFAQIGTDTPGFDTGFTSTVKLQGTDPRIIIANIINVALGFLGVLAVVLILYGGFLWMTSGGNDEKVEKAKKLLKQAVIGLAIILATFGIVYFIFRALGVNRDEGEALPTPATPIIRSGGGALGGGKIESHFPARNATGVWRNTRIIITFKEPINPASIATTSSADGGYFDAYDDDGDTIIDRRVPRADLMLRADAIQIIKTIDIENSVRESKAEKYLTGVARVGVSFTADLKTIVLEPIEQSSRNRFYLGSATEVTPYSVYLCGIEPSKGNCGSGIKLLDTLIRTKTGAITKDQLLRSDGTALGDNVFDGRPFKDYDWSFEVSKSLDLAPPTILNIFPMPDPSRDTSSVQGRQDKPRNAIVQIIFSEALLPTVASGRVVTEVSGVPATSGTLKNGTYDVITVKSVTNNNKFIAGEWKQSTDYKTSEFVSASKCGRNSCGQDVFCLPELSDMQIMARTASHTVSTTKKDFTALGLDGIQDIAGNALDGNENGFPGGNANIFSLHCLMGAPGETPCTPEARALGDNVKWDFWTNNIIDLIPPRIESTKPESGVGGVLLSQPVEMLFSKPMSFTTFGTSSLYVAGQTTQGVIKPWDTWWVTGGENRPATGEARQTVARITHGDFWITSDYRSKATNDVKDIYQNCYFPTGGGDCGAPVAGNNYCCDGVWSAQACF